MPAECEVCLQFRPELSARHGRAVRAVSFGRRSVLLCSLHARVAQLVRVTTFEGLRKLFRETRGQRSYVPRRLHEPRPGSAAERRASAGRRLTDAR